RQRDGDTQVTAGRCEEPACGVFLVVNSRSARANSKIDGSGASKTALQSHKRMPCLTIDPRLNGAGGSHECLALGRYDRRCNMRPGSRSLRLQPHQPRGAEGQSWKRVSPKGDFLRNLDRRAMGAVRRLCDSLVGNCMLLLHT